MKTLRKFIEEHPKSASARGVDTAEIKSQEAKLGVAFGPEYKAFLKAFGCLVVGPNEIYGICGKNNAIPSAIHATLSARKDKRFPTHLIVIAQDGRGQFLCIDSKDSVFCFEHGTTTPLNQSFEEFAISWLAS